MVKRIIGAHVGTFLLCLLLVLSIPSCGGSSGDAGPETLAAPSWFIPASIVLGQADFTGGPANQGGAAAANTLSAPRGRSAVSTTAGAPSYFCDNGNNRVLGYLSPPTVSNQPADFALGQINMTNTAPGGGASQFTGPSGVHAAGGKLFLCDAGNNRVLIWNTLPTAFTPADVVIGQANFVANSPATTAAGLSGPRDVIVAGGRLIVVDTGNNRVLIWNVIPTATGTPADVVVGQGVFFEGGVNSTGHLSDHALAGPQATWSDGTRLAVADTGNSRVLMWSTLPVVNGASADIVLGQPHFQSSLPWVGPNGMTAPAGIASDGTRFFVCDTENARILVWNTIPTAIDTPADGVLGQSNFANREPNDDNQDGTTDAAASARTFGMVAGLEIAGGRLYTTGLTNSRILVFDLP